MNPSQSPPHTPRIKPIPLPALPSIPDRHYRDGQLTPLTPHPSAQQIHDILQPTTTSPSSDSPGTPPLIYYDFKDPPSKIIFGDPDGTASSLRLLRSTPATKIPLKQLRILLPTTPPGISVIVSNPHFVSVLDILETIYSTLHAPIGPSVGDDLDLPAIRNYEDSDSSETSLRLSSLIVRPPVVLLRGNSYDYHPFQKLMSPDAPRRKIDYLGGRTTFAGLTRRTAVEGFGPVTWELHTT